ncbi:hypothetical protein DFR37_101319 [Eoetvoesiella caeni]|uniref:Uncharacterized protein n=1 Tax=Eoetvoesiella caeni TaxID=645616 RepID=A0A366HLW1_9BURK|nr:hypothetical protein DFR37_101319 [Eoetvoesiella caeni]
MPANVVQWWFPQECPTFSTLSPRRGLMRKGYVQGMGGARHLLEPA